MGTPRAPGPDRPPGQPYDPYIKEHRDEAVGTGGKNAAVVLVVAVLAVAVALVVLL